jgi:hypothetical protein
VTQELFTGLHQTSNIAESGGYFKHLIKHCFFFRFQCNLFSTNTKCVRYGLCDF